MYWLKSAVFKIISAHRNKRVRSLSRVSVKYDCVNKSVDEFEELFTNITDKHAPMKTKCVRKKQSPWLNDDIIALMRERDRLKKAAIKSGSNASWSAYRSMRNHVNSSIKESKKQFINDGIVKSGKNTQQVWKHLRYVVPGKDKNNCINKIKVDDNIESTHPQVISKQTLVHH